MDIHLKSDKEYWHRYLDFYEENCFKYLSDSQWIMEWGVDQGASIQLLLERFPKAKVVGIDILPQQDSWPKQVSYRKIDQSQRDLVRYMYSQDNWKYDLIIEDGSHKVEHQAICLLESLPRINSNGYYIAEDLQTNLEVEGSTLYLLLALEHNLRKGKLFPNGFNSKYFTREEVVAISSMVDSIKIYRRATLPDECYMCRKDEYYDYNRLECVNCHIPLYNSNESITAIIKVK